jgi:hypothetical protein
MYTYIITAIIVLVALYCAFKNNKKFGTAAIIFIGITVIVTTTVNTIRKNKLPIKDEISYIKIADPIIISHDTMYIKSDTLKEDDSSLFIYEEKLDITPKNMKNIKTQIINNYAGLIFTKDSLIKMYYRDDKNKLNSATFSIQDTLYESVTTHFEYHIVYHVGDNWTIGWSIPKIKDYYRLRICKKDMEYLHSVNPKLFAKWKIVKL